MVGAVTVMAFGRFPAAAIMWQRQPGSWAFSVVAKATFLLRPGVVLLAPEQEAMWPTERPYPDGSSRGVYAPCDLVPIKARADVMLVGEAVAPGGQAVRGLQVRLHVGAIDKRIEVVTDRQVDARGTLREGAPFQRLPLVYERAAGGPETRNPIGVDRTARDAGGRAALPNLRLPGTADDAATSAQNPWIEPEGFGPIAAQWPSRRELLRSFAGHIPTDWRGQSLPPDIDFGYFNAAPRDQQLRELRGDESIVMEHLHPELARWVSSLPGQKPRAFVETAAGVTPLPMRCDTLWIDATRGICTLTWRGARPMDQPPPAVVLLAMEPPGRTLTWDDLDRLRRAQPPPSAAVVAAPEPQSQAPRSPLEFTMAAVEPDVKPRDAGGGTWSMSAQPGADEPSGGLPFLAAAAPRAFATTAISAGGPPSALPFAAASAAAPPASVASPPMAVSAPPASVSAPPMSVSAPPASEAWSVRGGAVVPTFLAGQARAIEAPPLAPPTPVEPSLPLRSSPSPSSLRSSASRAREAIQLVWFDPAELAQARRLPAFAALLDELHDAPLDLELDDSALDDDPADVEDRREALEIVVRGAPQPGERAQALLAEARCPDGRLLPPIALFSGELALELDALEELKATLSAAAASAGVDPEAREVIDVARKYLASPGLPGSSSVAEGLASRIRDTFDKKNLLTERHLRGQAERALLEGRLFRRSSVLGARHVCALLHAGGEPLPTYLPEALAQRLPAALRLRVRLLARVLPGLDAQEPSPAALWPIALALVTRR